MIPTAPIQHPRPGMLATIRSRRGLIASVEPFDSQEGRLQLVRVEYTDSDGLAEDTVLWEREHGRDLLEPNALPQVQASSPLDEAVMTESAAKGEPGRWPGTAFGVQTGGRPSRPSDRPSEAGLHSAPAPSQ